MVSLTTPFRGPTSRHTTPTKDESPRCGRMQGMNELYVERSIEIDASPSHIWEVLTKPDLPQKWAGEFSAAGPIESDWTLCSSVL